jgi:hypothetical protein
MWKGEWHSKPPCPEEILRELIRLATVDLPPEYLVYLRESNGGGGDIGVEPGLLYLWKAEEVPLNNDGYEVHLNVPGFYAFGTSGGGEMFAFDTRRAKPWPIVMIPFIPMCADEAVEIASDFATLSQHFGSRLDEPPEEICLDDWGRPIEPDSNEPTHS